MAISKYSEAKTSIYENLNDITSCCEFKLRLSTGIESKPRPTFIDPTITVNTKLY